MKSIVSIFEYVKKLSKKDKELFNRIYTLTQDYGYLKIPKEMKDWTTKTFGSIESVEKQKIIRIDNNITFESTLFNELRTKRPIDSKTSEDLNKLIKEKQGDPFCNAKTGTPEDSFGRIKGKKSITASNVAKYDAQHGLVIFNEHNPLKFTLEDIKDYLKTSESWIKKSYQNNPKRKFPYITWNCLWKAGASIIHGHIQILLAKDRHYQGIEQLRKNSLDYQKKFHSDYFEDLFMIHKSLGLGFEKKGVKVLVHLTPKKEKELLIISKDLKSVPENLYRLLQAYLKMGVKSFNIGIYHSPLDNSWKMPIITRIVDRGNLFAKTGDMGGMELFAGTSVVGSDPYKIIEKIKS